MPAVLKSWRAYKAHAEHSEALFQALIAEMGASLGMSFEEAE